MKTGNEVDSDITLKLSYSAHFAYDFCTISLFVSRVHTRCTFVPIFEFSNSSNAKIPNILHTEQ